ncbi:putative fatty acyl-CoA reductase CG8306 [Teleopsis dalmanni]|uniref:putative fatty acyl-CoA reductase CG8306 n=1 Tax=Teleopsis dalmanni TaxID=139649 RepID=UPI0018CEC53E|nr:putative fatty acyl-CoA reductase CG8306 [Teleopsis dalmanni]XP_037955043.1 putative fatty acyl-CoA reductase CG8306 [Teleopsis dalmanni]
MAENISTPVKDFYAGRNVFITGATGFVGVTIIEKLLRDIPNIATIYLLMRPKKGKSVEQRLEDIKNNSVFDKFKESKLESRFSKLVPIEGDVGEEHLGISEINRQILIENVHVVFHSAATLDFFQTLKTTTNINLRGTRRVVELCKQIQNLQALVHVSSAYVNSYITEVEEKLYPSPDDPEKVIHLAETLTDEALKDLEPKLLKDHPNTYTFTKHLAEHEVANVAKSFPCGIVRPSMITPAWKQPIPGWTISKNGPQGFFMGASNGILRRLPLDPSIIMDYIPVDVVVNAIITTGYYVNALKIKNGKPAELQIFHLTSSTYKPFRFELLINKINRFLHDYPLVSAVWYPNLKLVRSLFLFRLGAILFHFIPGYILDFVTKLSGGRPILVKLHKNVWNSLSTLERFIFTEWHYDNRRALEMAKSLDKLDQSIFFLDIGELSWDEYFQNTILGVRQYLSKESPKTLNAARKKDKVLLAMHVGLQLAFYYGFFKLIILLFGISNAKAALLLPVVYYLLGLL